MLRWHTSSCTDPLISSDEFGLSCQSCPGTHLFGRQSVPRDTHASLNIPKDQPLGHLNLRWPPSVLYTSNEERDDGDGTSETVRGRDNTLLSSERRPQNAAHSSIYRPLEDGQFRLIYLDSTKSQSDLIHLDLEQHDLDNCPEYEATSYAWTGEDDKDQSSNPIFIGNFYDVALQTKNCASMLKYLRPSRGIRMVWIDAICIDQSNIREREKQVIAMRDIYRNASRVVVYLGPKTVQQSNQEHRRRSRLDELDAFGEKDTLKIDELFSHRYFRRVWVIQELLLAKSLCMPLEDSDYYADSTSIKRMDVHWIDSKVPWFQHIAGGRMFSRNEIGLLLDQTWYSRATDPRDKLFGVLGLADTASHDHKPPGNGEGKGQLDYSLLPDYTLSEKEIFIGLVAYVVIVLEQWHILERAAGLGTATGYPTWVPNRQDPSIWRARMTAKQDDCDLVRPWYENMGLCCKEVWTIASGFQDKDIEWRHRTFPYGTGPSEGDRGAKSFGELRAMMTARNAANEKVSIHSSTAALSIELIRIIKVSSRPRSVAKLGSLRMFEFVMAQHSLLICTALIKLHKILDDTPTWIFLRDIDDGTGPIVFFLREAHQAVENSAYELIYCCRCWDLLIFRRPQQTIDHEAPKSSPHTGESAHRQPTPDTENEIMKMKHADDCYDIDLYGRRSSWGKPLPYETLHAAASIINTDAITGRKSLLGFPTERLQVKDILPLLQLLADAGGPDKLNYGQFGERYILIVNQFSSASCSMKSPCHIDFRREDGRHLGAKPSQDYGNIFVTIDAATWATYKDLWGPGGEYSTSLRFVLVNQKVTKVIEVGDKGPSGSHDFEGSDIIYRSKRRRDTYHGKCHWMGWSRLGVCMDDFMVERARVNEEATVYVCIPLYEIVQYMHEHDLAKHFYNLAKFRRATGWDETTIAQNTKESYRNIFTHPWPESLREEIGLIGEPCRIQIT